MTYAGVPPAHAVIGSSARTTTISRLYEGSHLTTLTANGAGCVLRIGALSSHRRRRRHLRGLIPLHHHQTLGGGLWGCLGRLSIMAGGEAFRIKGEVLRISRAQRMNHIHTRMRWGCFGAWCLREATPGDRHKAIRSRSRQNICPSMAGYG